MIFSPNISASAPVLGRNVTDAARAIGVSRATIYRLAAAGKLRIVKIAGRSTVPESDLARVAEQGASLENAA